MIRLSFDLEAWRRGISTMPLPEAVHAQIEADLRSRLLQHVAAGAVFVTHSSRPEREVENDIRAVLDPTGVVPETVYLATDRRTVLDRMRTRRSSDSDDFVLSEALVIQYFDNFEPPTPDEGPLTVIR